MNKDYVYPTNPGNINGVTAQSPGGWIQNSLGYYVSGRNSWAASVISNGFTANLTNCMIKCQETANCIYVTYSIVNSNCWLCKNYLSQANTTVDLSFSIGVIVQNPLITKRYY
jgi:hypothetical protein